MTEGDSSGRLPDDPWDGMTAGRLREALASAAKLWLAHDGLWFQAVEKRHGMDAAMDADRDAWHRFSPIEARRIINTMWDRQAEEGEENEFIRDALAEAQEELAFREDVLDTSFSGYDWDGEWAEAGEEFDYDEDNGSSGHDY